MSVLQSDGVASGVLAPVETALDELQRRICRLVLEALLVELQVRLQVGTDVEGGDTAYLWGFRRGRFCLNRPPAPSPSALPQPLFAALPSRLWLSSSELLEDVCERTARFCRDFQRVRNPAVQVSLGLKAEEWGKRPLERRP